MEEVGESLKASKVTIVSSSYFSSQATNYALRKNIKLVDRNDLLELAKKYQDRTSQTTLDNTPYDGGASAYIDEEYPEYRYDASDMEYLMQRRDQNPHVYKNTLYRQVDEKRSSGISSLLNRVNSPISRGGPSTTTNLYNYNQRQYSSNPLLFKLINNPIIFDFSCSCSFLFPCIHWRKCLKNGCWNYRINRNDCSLSFIIWFIIIH